MAFIDPARYPETPVRTLLDAAAHGCIGIDRRLIHAIVDRGPSAGAAVLAYANESYGQGPITLDPLLADLFRHFGTPEALDFFIDLIRKEPEEVPDELVECIVPFGERAVDPLIALYEELGEEQGHETAFLLASLRVRDPRVLEILLDRLEYDVIDGALALSLYGDPAAGPALERMLGQLPKNDTRLIREVRYAIDQLQVKVDPYESKPFDIFEPYDEESGPVFSVLKEADVLEAFASPDAEVRAKAAESFFNKVYSPKARAALVFMAENDADAKARGRAWEALSGSTEDPTVRNAMLTVLTDASRSADERGGAAVALWEQAAEENVRNGILALYREGGDARAKALEAMWRSLYRPFAEYFPASLDDPNPDIVREALRGLGYFQMTAHLDRIEKFFEPEDFDVREEALFAYALAMPGETSRGRVRGMLRKIDDLAGLTQREVQTVMFALDERLALKGLEPVFANDGEIEEDDAPPAPYVAPRKVGRNDPCPCNSGKKYKKCHGA